MGSRLTITPPADFLLPRDVCSYGYFLLAPNHWDVQDQSLTRPLELEEGPATVRIAQPGGAGAALRVTVDRAINPLERKTARAQISRMLRLDEDDTVARAFHKIDKRWKKRGQARLFRSPTMFEDVIKTVSSCNVTWPSTVHMNRRLCDVLGRASAKGAPKTFPAAEKLARTRPGTLRGRCRVGYRDQRMVDLGKLFRPRGFRPPEYDPAWFEDPANTDDAVHKRLLELPGVGPYAAANIMQLLGRYAHIPLDTESVRHGKSVLGYAGTDRQILRKVAEHYEPFGEHKFRSYWFELWQFYESKRGPAHLWDRDGVGASFTASQF